MPWGGGTCWQEAALSAAAGRAGKGCPAQTPRGGNRMYSRFIAVVAIRIMCFSSQVCPLCQRPMEYSAIGRTYKVGEGREVAFCWVW